MDETGNPYPFDFFETIVGINFPQSGGFAVVSLHYIADKLTTAPAAIAAVLSGLPYPGTWNVFGNVLSGKKPAVVVNPVSADMKQNLFQWSQLPAFSKVTADQPKPTFVFYVTDGFPITAQNYTNPFPGFNQCGDPLRVLGAHGGTVFDCNPQLLGQAAFAGFNPARIKTNIGGSFASADDAQYFAAAFNSTSFAIQSGISLSAGSFQTGTPAANVEREVRANFVLNLNLIQTLLPKDVTTFTFKIALPAPPASSFNWNASAMALKSTNLPVSALNQPQLPDYPQTDIVGNTAATINGVVDIKNLKITLSV